MLGEGDVKHTLLDCLENGNCRTEFLK